MNLTTDARTARYRQALEFAQLQVAATIERSPDYFPIYTSGGRWRHEGELWTDWTGGFFAGMMWRFFEQAGDETWRQRAEHYSRLLEHRQHDRNVHDLGFIFLNTYRPWYRLTGEAALNAVLIQAGRTLAMRFMEKGQYLRSFVAPESLFIDIMMNVPLIFYAARETGDEDLLRIATAHCRTTRDKLVRPDGSTAHEGIFDTTTGEFLREDTHQGWRGDSAWARGLAWSLYGYSQCYGLTGSEEFLEVAERNAAFWLANLPADKVPDWDFRADLSQPLPWGPQKDSSAGAIAASGLLDLAEQTRSAEKATAYRDTALAMLDALAGPDYLAEGTPGWEGILKHGVYHTKKNLGVDESVMWGEFFFVEALCKIGEPEASASGCAPV
ncbi:MAG TPA: glycoside hydrolase family 88 protein [Pirellulales bacterium]|nr:glycoside hydrolase family 88 protein [Pirellulales bacterium]